MLSRLLSSSPAAVALECSQLTKVFPIADGGMTWRILLGLPLNGNSVTALDNISLSVETGKIVGILGRNGAGKSTLLRVLAGVYSPSAGKIRAHGDVCGLFELGGIRGSLLLTGREYARRFLTLQGAKTSQLENLIEDVRVFSELGEFFERRIYTYSTGMAARLYFATATALQCAIYLIDEILSVGDEHFQGKCWHRIRERLSNGASGLLVTHDWSAVLKLCEESHVIERGRIVRSGPSDKVVVSYLRLPPPEAKIARFSEDSPSFYVATTGEDMEFCFSVELLESGPVAFGYSIEMLRLGMGWEIMLMSELEYLTDKIGKHKVALRIPKFPLAPGHYSFNLFLNSAKKQGEISESVGYDVRSWTYGNGFDLTVTGKTSRSPTVLPMTWYRQK